MSRHLNPAPPAGDRRILDIGLVFTAGLAVLAATVGTANEWAPRADQPHAAALPTTLEKTRELSGHGGPIGPLAIPSIGADGAWQPENGPVIVNGQALARPTVVGPENLNDTAPVQVSAAEPEPEPAPPVAPATTAEPTPTPVVVAPEPTEPEVTEPVGTPVETTPPTEPPADPIEPVVEVGS